MGGKGISKDIPEELGPDGPSFKNDTLDNMPPEAVMSPSPVKNIDKTNESSNTQEYIASNNDPRIIEDPALNTGSIMEQLKD